jgi:hypothetical protein
VQYRIYCFDGADKVWAAEWIEADSDEAAIQATRARHTGVQCEIWQQNRLVAKIDLGASAPADEIPSPRAGPAQPAPD